MKKNAGTKWLLSFFTIVMAAIIFFMTTCYVVDPFFAYRVRDNVYMISEGNSLPGIIKNDNYDSLLIGSSMTQNFKMDSFKKKLNLDAAKISVGGMVLNDVINLTDLAHRVGKAKKYYICVDLPRFLNDGKKERVPDFLIDDNPLNNYKYFLGYSTWMRYIPVDLALVTAKKLGISLGKSIEKQQKLDEIGYWGDSAKFGKDFVVRNYRDSKYNVTEVMSDNYYKDIVENADLFIESFSDDNVEYNCFFPPYSILYWCNAEEEGYLEELIQGKKYIIDRLKEKGCNVFDFQHSDFVCDLDNYKDITHYSPQINEWMIDCFANGMFLCDEKNITENSDKIVQMIRNFKDENKDIFAKK